MSRHRRLAFIASLACLAVGWFASAASAEVPRQVYTGTLGKQAIVLELAADEDAGTAGRYFYTRHHHDLMLVGGMAATGHLQLTEGRDEDAPRPQLTLDRQPGGGWRGNWRSPQGRTLSVVLQPARPAAPAADASPYLKRMYASDPYEYLRLSGLPLRTGHRTSFMGHTLQWWIEPESKISLFDIVDGYPDAQRQRINRVLRNRLWKEVSAYYDCMAAPRDPSEADYEQTVTPRLLTPGLVSVSVFTDYYCGGAHPDFVDDPINLDARNAQALTLEDVLWVGTGKPLRYVGNMDTHDVAGPATSGTVGFDAFAGYREKKLAPWLEQELARRYPARMTGSADDECGYEDPGVWQFVSWHLTPRGVFFGPSFPRVARVCETNDDWSVLPWPVIRAHPGRLSLMLPGSG